MTKTIKKTIVTMLAAALVCSCGQLNDDTQQDCDCENNTVTNNEASLVLRLEPNAGGATRSAEDSYDYTQGTPEEYRVNTARVYLFESRSKLFDKSVLVTNLTRQGSDQQGNVVYETERISVPQGTYDIFVVANSDRQMDTSDEMTFLSDIDAATYQQGLVTDISRGIVMTNRASANLGVTLTHSSEGTDNVVSVSLERVLARLDVAKGSDSFALTDNLLQRYATVTLTDFYIVNVPRQYYSWRHTAQLTSLDEPSWSLDLHFGNVSDVDGYVIDPYFFHKTLDASGFTNADKYYEHYYGDIKAGIRLDWSAFNPAAATPQYKTAYCTENCMLAPAQKNGYTTGVVFRAKLEPNNNVYQLASDGQTLELATGAAAQPEVLYYYEYRFYNSPEALAKGVGVTSVSAANLDIYQARKFEKTDDGYQCYYRYWIRHLDNNDPTQMGVMEFGVVRNNLYRMLITNVSGVGDAMSGDDPLNPPFNPDIPDEGETQLKVILNVKPWIVRDLTNIVL